MKPALKWLLVIVALGAFAWSATVLVQRAREVRRAHHVREATEQLRTSYFSVDYEGGALRGAKLVRRFPEARELKAWYVSCVFFSDRDQAIRIARQMTLTRPNEPWGWFALAMSTRFTDEALKASEKALALNPRHPDFLYLRASMLFGPEPENVEEAIAFVDQHRSDVANPADLLTIKAKALHHLGTQVRPDPEKVNEAFEILDEARRLDPSNFHAAYSSGALLSRYDPEKALPLLREAIRLQPGSFWAHLQLWRAYNALDPPLQEKLRTEIEADVEDTLTRHAGEPAAMSHIAEQYGDLGMADKQEEIEDRILKENPGTKGARDALWYRLFRIERFLGNHNPGGETPPSRHASFDLTGQELSSLDAAVIRERNADIHRFILSYLDHPASEEKGPYAASQDQALLGQMYLVLFDSLDADPNCDPEKLLRAVRGMRDHPPTFSSLSSQARGVVALAERRIALDEAVEMARDSIARGEKQFKEADSVESNAQARRDRAQTMGRLHDALGWVLYRSGHTSEARKELEQAYSLNPGDVENLYHLGQLARGASNLKRAERLFAECAVLPYLKGNPCPAALEALFRQQHGSTIGYEQYYEGILEKGRSLKKKRLLASRLPDPRPIPPFHLKTLDGEVTSSESLKGKVTVVHFWGFW